LKEVAFASSIHLSEQRRRISIYRAGGCVDGSPAKYGAQGNPLGELLPPLTPNEAAAESARCLMCYDAPCTHACPTHIDIPKFIKKISTGKFARLGANDPGVQSARSDLRASVPGAGIVRRSLRAGLGTQADCDLDRLQRHAMDFVYGKGIGLFAPSKSTGKKVAVIGAGPAGLSCAESWRNAGTM